MELNYITTSDDRTFPIVLKLVETREQAEGVIDVLKSNGIENPLYYMNSGYGFYFEVGDVPKSNGKECVAVIGDFDDRIDDLEALRAIQIVR